MKTSEKAVILGVVSFVGFLFGNLIIGTNIGIIIPGGDDFVNSYFYPLYTGVTVLSALVISCTYVIVKKINLLMEEIKKIIEK